MSKWIFCVPNPFRLANLCPFEWFWWWNSQPHSYQKWLEIVGLEKPAPKMTAEQEKAFESHILEKFQNLLNLRNDLSSGNQRNEPTKLHSEEG